VTIRFLIADAFSVGGTIRATFATAAGLADRHEVEVVSVYRRRATRALELDPRVRLRALTDDVDGAPPRALAARARARPSRLIHPDDARYARFDGRTDVALLRFLRSVGDGVLIGTRPGLNLAVARFARAGVVRIGQDHMNLGGYELALRAAIARHYPRLDAVTALTEGTAEHYRELLGPRVHVACIPNAAPAAGGPRARPGTQVVAAAGRLTRRKGFDRLLRAWARIADDHPGWRLEIFGRGPERAALARLARELGVADSVALRGHHSRLPEALAGASVFAMTSRREGFPMVLLEAMSAGLGVVAYDCPTGPRDVVTDAVDGYVVPDGATDAFAAALARLMASEDRRSAFGAAALATAERYRSAAITERWERLLAQLPRARRPSGASARGPA
jgi:glycosyltransferase involved in cell wall biosynthesis